MRAVSAKPNKEAAAISFSSIFGKKNNFQYYSLLFYVEMKLRT
jgi:hypothetical protein